MRTLLDTNILIHREASVAVNKDIGHLFQWLDKTKSEKVYHPDSMEEIEAHGDTRVVETMKVKVGNYTPLRTISEDSAPIIQLRKNDKTRNDEIDTNILKELYHGRVEYLITEDRGIHAKAVALGIDHSVFTIDSFIEKCTAEYPELTDYNVLAVQKKHFADVDISDEFFDSFKRDYAEFENWFRSKSDNLAYVCHVNSQLGAFLYLKIEREYEVYSDISPVFTPKKRLKIGTFKVTSTGYRLGERFLKIIFDNAIVNGVDEIYVTIFNKTDDQSRLIALLSDWGFNEWGVKTSANGVEKVFVRDFSPSFNTANCQLSYPYLSKNNPALLVPIYPAYHTELLPDSFLTNESPEDFVENEPHRNAIKKTYVSRSFNRNVKPGDIVIFYRTKDGGPAIHTSVVSTIGVVESVHDSIESEEKFIELCRKRSVFDDDELRRHWRYKFRNGEWVAPFIVNFLYTCTLPPPRLNLGRLIELGVVKNVESAPRGFQPINAQQLESIITNAGVNENYFVD